MGLETDEVAEANAKVIDLSLERSERTCVVKGCHPLREFPLTLQRYNEIFLCKIFFVEMGGLEPPSKHRTRELSTRLVCLWFSTQGCRKTGHLALIL